MKPKHLIFGAGLVALCVYGALHPAPHTGVAPVAVKAAQIGDRVYFAHRATSCSHEAAFTNPALHSSLCQGWVDPDTYGKVIETDKHGHYCVAPDGEGSFCHWFYDVSFTVITKEKL